MMNHDHAHMRTGLFTPTRESLRGVKATCTSWSGSCLFGRGGLRAVRARLVRALAGAGACSALGREGRTCLLVSGDQLVAWERAQQVLWAHEGSLRTCAGACQVL